jgi:peptide chain release factor 2
MQRPDFWADPTTAQAVGQERTRLEEQLRFWKNLSESASDLTVLFELALEENDESLTSEIQDKLNSFTRELDVYETRRILSGEMDFNNAIVEIHAGAGGTEAMDWVSMLYRMYLRYADRSKFKYQELDRLDGEEAGIKSVTFFLEGPYAYGLMRSEVGIHRLVRISPFDSNSRRHTSFASVFVTPEINDNIVIEINEKDLRIDVYRASGAGGQHINKTSSAVRITHIPTGIVVQCQDDRSQHRNKDMAMKVLKGRLYQLEQDKKAKELKELHNNKLDIAWGSQIRSYTLQPYRLIKDHRTSHESGNVDAVLDGDLYGFIKATLHWKADYK